LYIVNIAVRLLAVAFVLVGGAITFAGPQLQASPAISNQAADTPLQEAASTADQSLNATALQDLG
jgi:FlaG/FlaF family flagellin (archaellin)